MQQRGKKISQYFPPLELQVYILKAFGQISVLNYPLFPLCVPVIIGACFAELFKITIIQPRVHFSEPTATLTSIPNRHYLCLLKCKNVKSAWLPGTFSQIQLWAI